MGLKALGFTAALLGAAAIATTYVAHTRTTAAEQAYPPAGDFVTTSLGRVHYVQQGSGPHVVLLHGAGGNLREFTFDLMGRLTDRYTVTAFDRPGLGYTDRLPGMSSGAFATSAEGPREQAQMLREAAENLGISDPIVTGHSFGGIVAYAWAVEGLDTPSQADAAAIVSLAGVTMPWPGDLGAYYTLNGSIFGGLVTTPLISAFVPDARVQQGISGIFAPQSVPPGYADHIGAPLSLRLESFRTNIRQVNTLRPEVVKLADRYPELTLPVEILHGTADTTVPITVHAKPFSAIVPSAHLVPLDGVGHMPHHADPDAAVAAIDRASTRSGLTATQ